MADLPPPLPVVFHFKVAFKNSGDDQDNRFQEVAGLSTEITLEEYREGGMNDHVHRLPTGTKFNNLVLKRGYVGSTKVATWCRMAIESFSFERTDVDVSLLNAQHEPLAHWSFIGAWPVKWTLSDLKAQENAVAIESLELAYRSFRKVEA